MIIASKTELKLHTKYPNEEHWDYGIWDRIGNYHHSHPFIIVRISNREEYLIDSTSDNPRSNPVGEDYPFYYEIITD